jgi:hypothetical protein
MSAATTSARRRRAGIAVSHYPVPVVRDRPSPAVHVYTLPVVRELPLQLADASIDATW